MVGGNGMFMNLEINLFMTKEIYVSRELSYPLHYKSLHSLPHYHTYSYISHQHTVSPAFMSLPTVPQYSQISYFSLFIFLFFFSLLTRYPFIISYSSIPSFKSFTVVVVVYPLPWTLLVVGVRCSRLWSTSQLLRPSG